MTAKRDLAFFLIATLAVLLLAVLYIPTPR